MERSLRFIAILVLLLNGISGLAGGFGLLTDPSGAGVGMSTRLLEHAPFHDFLIPALALFSLIGVFSMITLLLALRRNRRYPLLMIAEGLMLLIWLTVQVFSIRTFHSLQLVFGLVAFALIGLGLLLRKLREKFPQAKNAA